MPNETKAVERVQNEIVGLVKSSLGRQSREIQEIADKQERLRAHFEEMRHELNSIGSGGYATKAFSTSGSPGQQVASDADSLEHFRKSGHVRIPVESGLIQPLFEAKATVTSADLGFATPGVLRGERDATFTTLSRRRLTLRDLIESRPTSGPSVEFLRESTAPTVSPQVEASSKIEGSFAISIEEAKVRTIAGWIPASRQAVDDLPELERLINESLLFELAKTEEDQILTGDGTGENLNGIVTQAGAYQGTHNVAGDNKADRLRHAVLELEAADEQPNFIALHPTDWHDVQLLKTEDSGTANTGQYLIGSPLGQAVVVRTLWDMTLVVTTAMSAGSFLVGDRSKARIFDRMQATVDISTEHANFFTENKIAIRAEERIALAVYRTSAFLTGSF